MFCCVLPCTNPHYYVGKENPSGHCSPLGLMNDSYTSITSLKYEDWTRSQIFVPAPYASKVVVLQEVHPTNFHTDIRLAANALETSKTIYILLILFFLFLKDKTKEP